MADVFVSYASEDRERASALAQALGARGWSVWWDRHLVPGHSFDQAIERELESARCVVALWSQHSVGSEWVKNEAALAAERGTLVPAFIDDVKPPLEFRRRQAARLVGWSGEPDQAGFLDLCRGIEDLLGAAPAGPPPQAAGGATRRSTPVLAIAAIAVLVALGLLYALWPSATGGPDHAALPPSASEYDAGTAAPSPATPPAPTPSPMPAPAPQDATATAAPPQPGAAPAPVAELAPLVAGRYHGDVIADSKGPSRTNVGVTVSPTGPDTVRVSSPYARLDGIEVKLSRNGNTIYNAEGDTPFLVDLDRQPPSLIYDPRSELAYRGTRQP
jgi:hypothetical protein